MLVGVADGAFDFTICGTIPTYGSCYRKCVYEEAGRQSEERISMRRNGVLDAIELVAKCTFSAAAAAADG